MKPGDTVVISASAGSVGQIAGQVAKLGGGRAIALTSSDEKLAWCREVGYDDGQAREAASQCAKLWSGRATHASPRSA